MQTTIRHLALLLGVALAIAFGSTTLCAASAHPPIAVSWVFAIHAGSQDVPSGKVFLVVNGKRILIEPNAQWQFRILERNEFHDAAVPATALSACSGWFAGGGEDFYIVRRAKKLAVYRRYLDEQAPIEAYRRIRLIAMPQR